MSHRFNCRCLWPQSSFTSAMSRHSHSSKTVLEPFWVGQNCMIGKQVRLYFSILTISSKFTLPALHIGFSQKRFSLKMKTQSNTTFVLLLQASCLGTKEQLEEQCMIAEVSSKDEVSEGSHGTLIDYHVNLLHNQRCYPILPCAPNFVS